MLNFIKNIFIPTFFDFQKESKMVKKYKQKLIFNKSVLFCTTSATPSLPFIQPLHSQLKKTKILTKQTWIKPFARISYAKNLRAGHQRIITRSTGHPILS